MSLDVSSSTLCPTCHGKGWLRLPTGWPIECSECTPTKTVKGRVVLDKATLRRMGQPERRKPVPVIERKGFVPHPPFVDHT